MKRVIVIAAIVEASAQRRVSACRAGAAKPPRCRAAHCLRQATKNDARPEPAANCPDFFLEKFAQAKVK